MNAPRRHSRLLLVLAISALLNGAVGTPTIAAAPTAAIDAALAATLRTAAPGALIPVIVRLRDQVDLRTISGAGRAARLAALVTALRQRAAATQVGLLALLAARRVGGLAASVTPLWIINGVAA